MTPHHAPRALRRAATPWLLPPMMLLLAAACVSRSRSGPEASAAMAATGQWSASLQAQAGSGAAGSAIITPGTSSSETSVTLQLSGGTPNGAHPWHLHTGRCGEGGGSIVGEPSQYPPLSVGGDGSARASVTLPFPVPTMGDYRINVHRSATEMATVIACGNLTRM